MEYRNLGNSGLIVSAVGLGCNNIGRQVDQAGTNAIVAKCIELGMTLFDTADVYGAERGRSEEYLGRALKPHRRNIVLATKGSGRMGEGPYFAGASRRYLMDALEASLRRLDTDYVDLYQVHFPDAADADRGDAARAGRHGALRQGALRRLLQLQRAAAS